MKNKTVAVVGLGYVGLPLAVAFGRVMPTIGFDLSSKKIENYRQQKDEMGEVSADEFALAELIQFTDDATRLREADFVVVAVPTPIDESRNPDLKYLRGACETVGKNLKPGVTIVFESTVYPGCTEEECIPAIESASGKKWKQDFFIGYSPERINPGDRTHGLSDIVKVVSGDTPETADKLAALYGEVVKAGVFLAKSIQVAEAAKVIENTQRDLNIALINELSIIFHKLGIDTLDVLETAGTKWNFLPFRPGLVGGHCIGVDPFYLTYKAQLAGYYPEVVLAGRRINDGMGKFIAEQTVKKMISAGSKVRGAKVSVLGITFKEDCPDLRNSKVIDIIRELETYGVQVSVHDPIANPDEAFEEYGVELTGWEELPKAEAIIVAVAHKKFADLKKSDLSSKLEKDAWVMDVKGVMDLPVDQDAEGISYWRL